MSDPFSPIPEVRNMGHRHIVDNYGERWVMIDGVETKVANLTAAKELSNRQDNLRVRIRADLDALGIRDKTVKTEITLADGTKTTVDLLPPGDANILQFGGDPTPENIAIADYLNSRPTSVNSPKPTFRQRLERWVRKCTR